MSPSSLLKMAPRRRLEAAASWAPGPGSLRGEGETAKTGPDSRGEAREEGPEAWRAPLVPATRSVVPVTEVFSMEEPGSVYSRCEFGEPRLPSTSEDGPWREEVAHQDRLSRDSCLI